MTNDREALIAGLDLGTTMCKCAVYDAGGALAASASRRLKTDCAAAGCMEQSSAEWEAAAVQVMKEVCEKLGGRASRILALGVSAQGPSTVFVDGDGRPVCPTPIWQDTRCAGDGYELFKAVGYEWVGHGLPQTGFAAKLKWMSHHDPEAFRRSKHFHDTKGYLLRFLTGNCVTEGSSSPVGMDEAMLKECGIRADMLDEVIAPDSPAGVLRRDLAEETGFPLSTKVIAGLNDGGAAVLGAGLLDVGQGSVSLSTNGVARVVVDKKPPGKFLYGRSLFCWPYVDGKYIMGGFTKTAGDTVQWFIDLAYRDCGPDIQLARFNEEAHQSGIGARGVRFYPWLLGRGCPSATDSPSGCFTGLGRHHRRGDCSRAIFEGVAFALRDIGQLFRDMGYRWDSIRFNGGGMKSVLWRSIVSNTLGVEGALYQTDSLLGAAMLAGVGTGMYRDIGEACRTCVARQETEPVLRQNDAKRYNEIYQAYQKGKAALESYTALMEESTHGT